MQDIRQIDPNFRTEVITETNICYYSCINLVIFYIPKTSISIISYCGLCNDDWFNI